ncbi:MAG TPA: cytochrome c oxidase assembly protein [Rhizomicrobium sp.]
MMRRLAFVGGLSVTALVLLPPLSGLAEQLFSAHMTQHLLLIVVAAPLLVASRVFDAERIPVLRPLVQPVAAWLAFVSTFLFWHWPAAFQWAAGNEATRLMEHASILASAFLFWGVALSPKDQEWLSYGGRALFVMTAAVATDLPGVIMVFSPQALCTMPHEDALRWGLTPLEDQQIAGLLMWVPANLAFFSAATWLFARWISDAGESAETSSPSKLVTP